MYVCWATLRSGGFPESEGPVSIVSKCLCRIEISFRRKFSSTNIFDRFLCNTLWKERNFSEFLYFYFKIFIREENMRFMDLTICGTYLHRRRSLHDTLPVPDLSLSHSAIRQHGKTMVFWRRTINCRTWPAEFKQCFSRSTNVVRN